MGLLDTARTSEKYRKVMSSLTQYRVPGTPGYIAEVLPQERGVPEIGRKAYVRFTVLFHPERGVAWAVKVYGQPENFEWLADSGHRRLRGSGSIRILATPAKLDAGARVCDSSQNKAPAMAPC